MGSSSDNSSSDNDNNRKQIKPQGTVTTDTLNVRSGAGTSYSIHVTKVHKGDTVNIVGRLQMDGIK